MTAEHAERVYHLVPTSELRAGVVDRVYRPARFEADGFVHCAVGRETVLAVARDYLDDVAEPVWLLEIEPARLRAKLVYEPPAPIPGGGREHLTGASLFPHVYGPIDVEAITGAAQIGAGDGRFAWPRHLDPLENVLASLA